MAVLLAPCTGMFFISGDRCFCVTFLQFTRRRKELAAPLKPSPRPFPLLRHSLGFRDGRSRRGRGRGGVVWAEEELGGRYDLESEIYDFMLKSESPAEFPSKEELIAAGREDLAIAIAKEGGWLAYGWDMNEEENGGISSGVPDFVSEEPCEESWMMSPQRTPSVAGEVDACLNDDSNNLLSCSEVSSGSSSSHRPIMDAEALEDAGIEGILIRLEKERSLAFAFVSQKDKERKIAKEQNRPNKGLSNTVRTVERTERFISSSHGVKGHPSILNSDCRTIMDVNNIKSGYSTWRAWNDHKLGDPLACFEAAEIVSLEDQRRSDIIAASRHEIENIEKITVNQDMVGPSGSDCLHAFNPESIKDISERLQNLESQLTSTLHQLRLKTSSAAPYKGRDQESLLVEIHKLSDALEFQQSEIKNARDILRSTKAKLAVLEGRIALQTTETQKLLQEKQRRVDAAQRPLFILRSVSITWPNPASEVLLFGSFDGWANRRRMEKSNIGMFTLNLKLYPGRYEIKFIVDGVWAVDPLRPIVRNNGFENNLLIVS